MFKKIWDWLSGLFKKKDQEPTSSPPTPPGQTTPLPSTPAPSSPKEKSGWLTVRGNQLLDSNLRPVVLRGVNIACPYHLNTKPQERPGGKRALDVAKMAIDLGAKVIRVPVEISSDGYNKIGAEKYFTEHLDPVVRYVTGRGVYAIVDYHEIGDWESGLDHCTKFWADMAPRYAKNGLVIYEIFNEPTGRDSWADFKNKMAQPLVDLIRKSAPDNLILVGAPGYSSHHQDTAKNQVVGTNIAYAGHYYDNQWPDKMVQRISELVKVAPVIFTEIGWGPGQEQGGTTSNYGRPILKWFRDHGCSYTAWTFDCEWEPNMLSKGWYLRSGDFMGEEVIKDINL